MRALVSLLLIVLLVDTRARAPKRQKSALLVGGERATNKLLPTSGQKQVCVREHSGVLVLVSWIAPTQTLA
mgnify:CR=1 FL=1